MLEEMLQALPPLLVSLSVLGTFGGLGAMMVFARKEFRANWRGHDILVKNHLTKEELFIDGRLEAVSRKGGRGATHATLAGVVRHGNERVPVLVSIDAAFTVDAQIFVDGISIPVGAKRMPPAGTDNRAAPRGTERRSAQEDRRWRAARTILSAIRASKSSADASLMLLCDRAETQLLVALKKLIAIDATKSAHVTLAPASDTTAELDAIRANLEQEVARLLAGIQRLHIVALRDATEADVAAVRELLVAITTETELGNLSDVQVKARAAVPKSLG